MFVGLVLCVIVKTCSDSLFSIVQEKCQMFVAKLHNFPLPHNRKEFIARPLRCSCELFKGLMNINGNTAPLRLVENTPQTRNIEYTIRQGIASDKKSNKEFCAYIKDDTHSD